MLAFLAVGFFVLVSVKGAEVCYKRIGCFSDVKPWSGTIERPIVILPWAPEAINTRFLLYTVNNQNSYQRLLQMEDVNCIAVDWRNGSHTQYPQAVNNIRIVGAEVAYFVKILLRNFGYPPTNVHLIGHSLGAHAAGEAGKRQIGISRITGLDPAKPYFQDTPKEVHLDLFDGVLVDVLHTDAGPWNPDLGLGISQIIGHLDFFPNGGIQMPGCLKNTEILKVSVEDVFNGVASFGSCNHMRAVIYYTESITNSSIFTSYPCSSYATYQAGSCRSCPRAGCPKMGHYADQYRGVTASSQVFYLNTP